MNKSVAKKEGYGDVAIPSEFDLDSILDDADALNADMGQGDLAMPFLSIIQSNSPELDEGHAKFHPDAKAGMFVSKVDKALYDGKDGLELVSCGYDRRFVEWRPREIGGGRIADYAPEDPIVRTLEWKEVAGAQKPMLPNGNLLVETHYHYILYRPFGTHEGWQFGVLPCKGTMTKKSRNMNTALSKEKMVHPKTGEIRKMPRWFRIWRATTVREANDQNSWFNIEFTRERRLGADDSALYLEGKGVAQQAKDLVYEDILQSEGADEVVTPADKAEAIQGEYEDVPFN